jgi:[protein-PII] uridylyltransferase
MTTSNLFDANAFDAALSRRAQTPVVLFRDALKQGQSHLQRRFLDGADVAPLVLARADLIDQLLTRAFAHVANAPDCALVAVGGYGRGELHPHSDIDILLLVPDGAGDQVGPALERFVTFLWDIGLHIGHSVRTVAECVQEATHDVTIATNLMESRLLSGPRALYDALQTAVAADRIWPSREFFEAKLGEQIARHRKFNDTSYNLEPNIKEGPGGLRDIQMIGWVAKRHFGAATLHELVGHGFLTEDEFDALEDGQRFLWTVRFGLHVLTGRREDRLLFDHQRALAKQFGYKEESGRLAVEAFMKRYYRTVMELNRLNEMLLQLFREAILIGDDAAPPAPINNRFQSRNGFVEAVNDGVFKRYPFALLEIFLVLAQHPHLKGVRAQTIRLIRNHRYLINDTFRNDLRCRSLFMELLRQPHGITHELRRMNRYGVLAAYLPMFGAIVGQMQHDLFHHYTVDEHTLFVVRNLRRFTVPEYAHEFPMCSELIQRIPKPEVLYLAGLFHDIAKGRGGDHSTLGAEDARAFAQHHGLSEFDTRLLVWLVKNHLIMSTTAQRKDISDAGVVTEFATAVANQTRLDHLYLLTVADIRATNPNLWNSWKNALLTELYLATTRAFRRGLANPLDQREVIRETQLEARRLLAASGANADDVERLWATFGDDYFVRYSADRVAWHARAILEQADRDAPLVLIQSQGHYGRGGTEIFIYARDRDDLFAIVTTALDHLHLNIVDARIISTLDGHTLDTYTVLEHDGVPIANPARLSEIVDDLKRRLARPCTPPRPTPRHMPRHLKHFAVRTQITFVPEPDHGRTVMEVTTTDRPGLLAQISHAMIQCDVRLKNARIATLGERVEDIFYITDDNNRPLDDLQRREQLAGMIRDYLS